MLARESLRTVSALSIIGSSISSSLRLSEDGDEGESGG
jgi:hypothetical protein